MDANLMENPFDKKIRIGIDGRAMCGPLTGIGHYILELCLELEKILPNAEFFIYSHLPIKIPSVSQRWHFRTESMARHMSSILWLKFRVGSLCIKDRIDVFWGSGVFLPNLPEKIRTVITVYDLNHILFPETMKKTFLLKYKMFFNKDVRRSDTVLTISKGTRTRLYEHLGRRAGAVVPPAVAIRFQRPTDSEIRSCLSLYKIDSPYLLAVATWEPRKNLELLIRTFSEMKKEGLLKQHKLVLVGGKGWKDERLSGLVEKEQSSGICPLGYVPDEHLPSLYAGADVFVFPSVYEGFGMPVLEARACGARIVASDIPEIREAGGEEAVYVPPTAEGIRHGILGTLAGEFGAKSTDAPMPSWGESAQILASALVGQQK